MGARQRPFCSGLVDHRERSRRVSERVRLSARAHAQRPIGARHLCVRTHGLRALTIYTEKVPSVRHTTGPYARLNTTSSTAHHPSARTAFNGPRYARHGGSRSSEKFGPGPGVRRNDNYTAFTGPQRFLCTPATVRLK